MTSFQGVKLRVFSQMDLSPCDGCDGCGLRCTSGVPLSYDESLVIGDFLKDTENRDRVIEASLLAKVLDLGDGVEIEVCRFRNSMTGRCTIYPVRPLVCRLLGHVEWMPCPIDKVPHRANTKDAIELMTIYADQDRRAIEEWWSSWNLPEPNTGE